MAESITGLTYPASRDRERLQVLTDAARTRCAGSIIRGVVGPTRWGSRGRELRLAAHLLQLSLRGGLLGEHRSLNPVEQALEPTHQLRFRDPQLAFTRSVLVRQGQ